MTVQRAARQFRGRGSAYALTMSIFSVNIEDVGSRLAISDATLPRRYENTVTPEKI